jgi:AcrR family transcriptional regulator
MVYVRVGSRADLSDALAARLSDRLIAAARDRVSSSRLDRAALAGFFRTTLETMQAHRELFLYVTRGAGDDMSERTLYLAGVSAQPLADLLGRWRARQGREPDVARSWAYGIVGMLNMVALWWLSEGGRTAEELSGELADLVWSGLEGAR